MQASMLKKHTKSALENRYYDFADDYCLGYVENFQAIMEPDEDSDENVIKSVAQVKSFNESFQIAQDYLTERRLWKTEHEEYVKNNKVLLAAMRYLQHKVKDPKKALDCFKQDWQVIFPDTPMPEILS